MNSTSVLVTESSSGVASEAEAAEIKGLIKAAEGQFRKNLPEALSLSEQACARAAAAGDVFLIASALANKGVCFWRLARYAESERITQEALALLYRLPWKTDVERVIARCYHSLGTISLMLGNSADALTSYLKALDIYRALNDVSYEASMLTNIGNVYQQQHHFIDALEMYEKALALHRQTGNRERESIVLHNIGTIYGLLNDYPRALDYYLQTLALRETLEQIREKLLPLYNIGFVYFKTGDLSRASEFYSEAYSLAEALGDREMTASILLSQGNLLVKQEAYTDALDLLRQGLAAAESLTSKEVLATAHSSLCGAYKATGNFEQALFHHEAYHRFTQEMFNEDSDRRTRTLQITYDVQQAKRDAELERLRNVELAQALSDAETQRLEAEAQRREAEAQRRLAEEASAFKTELLTIAAHDLKNPLQAVSGFAELIKESSDLTAIQRMNRQVLVASQRMLTLITDLLDAATIEAGKLVLQLSPADISLLVRRSADRLHAQAQLKSQIFLLDLAPDCFAEVDVKRLPEVFDNLIGNAVKYSPHGTRIWIEVKSLTNGKPRIGDEEKSGSSSVLISVRDEGQGLSEEDMKKLFGKFQRLSARPTGGESSTGLGLSIVKQLVDLHGGKVWATSAGKGKGSTFYIELPAAPTSPATSDPSA